MYQDKRFFNKRKIILVLVFILGLIVRFYKINSPLADWHSWRQSDTASVTRVFVEQGINLFTPKYYDISSIQTGIFNPNGYRMVEFPFFNLIHLGFIRLFPLFSLEQNGRLVSIFFSMVSAFCVFYLGRRFINYFGGLISLIFFLFFPYSIFYSRVILPEPAAVSLALLGVVFFTKYIDFERFWYLMISGLFLGLSITIKPFTFFYLVPLIYLFIQKYPYSVLRKNLHIIFKISVFLCIVFLPFFLWRIWMNRFPEGIPFFEWMFNGDKIRFRPAFWRWLFTERIAKLILGIWGLPFLIAGLIFAKPKNYFIHWFLGGSLFYLTLVATANVRHDYYQVLIVPSLALTSAIGVVAIGKIKDINYLVVYPILIFCFFSMIYYGFFQVKEYYKINHPEIIAAGNAVKQLTSKDSLIIAPYNGDTAFLYQAERFGWPAIDDDLKNLIKRGADYYVSVNINDKDTDYVRKNFKIIQETDQFVIADLHQFNGI